MDGFLGTIKELILLFLLVSIGSALLDYGRVNSGELPLFCMKKYNEKTHIQTFRGIFYNASRKVSLSPDEELTDSSDIKFYAVTKKLDVPSEFRHHDNIYLLDTKVSEACGDTKLYFENKDIKVYTYCLESIQMSENASKDTKELSEYFEKDNNYIEEIINYLPLRGLAKDSESLLYRTDDKNIAVNGITMYRCQKKDNNDIYIGPVDMDLMNGFCGFGGVVEKEAKTTWKIVEEDKKILDKTAEVIFEDDKYIYKLSSHRSGNIFIVVTKGSEVTKIPLLDALNSGEYTIDELISRGLKVTKVDKSKEKDKDDKDTKSDTDKDSTDTKTDDSTNKDNSNTTDKDNKEK